MSYVPVPDDNDNTKKQMSNPKASYSSMTAAQVQTRLGFRFQPLKGILVQTRGVSLKYENTKEEV